MRVGITEVVLLLLLALFWAAVIAIVMWLVRRLRAAAEAGRTSEVSDEVRRHYEQRDGDRE